MNVCVYAVNAVKRFVPYNEAMAFSSHAEWTAVRGPDTEWYENPFLHCTERVSLPC
ncbi:hypothetical protein FEP07_05593 [Burkholderia multivorans]|jgi:hypothetical protein|nr:hypothetical protein [Burkholderia multivorans]MDR9268296.1 hypothetical protein [Burkholderia multivorans]MDR9284869.1 hypothetical protein [Burkholderia multivorans]MDR9290325.1 hypothetical protein [Burkholderia multivorans]MDR9312895.1 hypothetical protein [Burkholderia multivorans]